MRIVIAEDLALLRDGLIRLLAAHGFEVVEAVDNGPSLLRALTTHRPDVAVVDVRLPPSCGASSGTSTTACRRGWWRSA